MHGRKITTQTEHGALVLCILVLVPLAGQQNRDERKPFVSVNTDYVSANGKWQPNSSKAGDQLPFKQNLQIDCHRGLFCVEATAQVVAGEPQILVQYYKILRWDQNGIIAQDESPLCSTNQLNINFSAKSVVAIDSPKSQQNAPPHCKEITLETRTFNLISHP